MKTFLLTVALFAAVACAAPKNKRDVSHLLKDGEYLPPHHHEHHHHHEEESAPQPGYHYPVPQASLSNQYLAPQPSLNNQYLVRIAKAPEPVKAAPVAAPVEIAAPSENHLTFDAPVPEQDSFIVESVGKSSNEHEYAQQQVGSKYHYPVPQASLTNQYLAPQPSLKNQYLAPQPSVNKEYLAPQPPLNNQYLAPITKASEPEDIQLPSISYGVPVKAAPAPAPIKVAAPAEDHLIFDAPNQDSFVVESVSKSSNGHEYAQQQVGSNGGYVY